jgi:hypothetical protein
VKSVAIIEKNTTTKKCGSECKRKRNMATEHENAIMTYVANAVFRKGDTLGNFGYKEFQKTEYYDENVRLYPNIMPISFLI